MRRIVIEKAVRRLTLYQEGDILLQCQIALGKSPVGHKQKEGDGRTPEGEYHICLKRGQGKFGCALGISYPSLTDAQNAADAGVLAAELLPLFDTQKRPPWGTALGGEIYIHGGGAASDWTAGCVALEQQDMDRLFALCQEGDPVLILP